MSSTGQHFFSTHVWLSTLSFVGFEVTGIYSDLKSGNVLLADKEGATLKICDFGLSNLKPSSQPKSNGYFAGSLLWMVREAIDVFPKWGMENYFGGPLARPHPRGHEQISGTSIDGRDLPLAQLT